MNYLDKYGDFVNENIFKKWFSPSDEEKKKMGYVKDDEGKLIHPDDAKKLEDIKKDKISELKNKIEEKYKEYDIKWTDDLSFEFDYKNSLVDLIKSQDKSLSGKDWREFTFDGENYLLDDLIKSLSIEIVLHLNNKSDWEKHGLVNYVIIKQKMELSDGVNFTECYSSHRGSSIESQIKERKPTPDENRSKFYLYVTKAIDINYRLVDSDIIESWKSGEWLNEVISSQFKINLLILIETIKKSFTNYKNKLKNAKKSENIDYIKECFYDISDISKKSNISISRSGGIEAYFEIDGIKVISQSESVHTGSRRSGTANFNKAKFEINDITLEVFSMLAVAKARIEDKIPGCEITTTMSNGSIGIFIN